MCRKVLLMGDKGESPPFKADKYLCERGDREQGSRQQNQINTFPLHPACGVSISLVIHALGFCLPSTIQFCYIKYLSTGKFCCVSVNPHALTRCCTLNVNPVNILYIH